MSMNINSSHGSTYTHQSASQASQSTQSRNQNPTELQRLLAGLQSSQADDSSSPTEKLEELIQVLSQSDDPKMQELASKLVAAMNESDSATDAASDTATDPEASAAALLDEFANSLKQQVASEQLNNRSANGQNERQHRAPGWQNSQIRGNAIGY
ncbi:hypothetical protein BH09PSE5_BH09PSE5_12450 [soil metagenome]